MRKILFRGKKEKDGAWVYGGFGNDILGGTGPYIVNFIADDNSGILISPEDFASLHFVSVLPETVGQFTGLTDDKNGEKIFEGDIIDIHYENTIVRDAVVKYIGASFYGETVADTWELDDYLKIEVIGNIHDNPELVRGAEK